MKDARILLAAKRKLVEHKIFEKLILFSHSNSLN